jgi:hypothetical protein
MFFFANINNFYAKLNDLETILLFKRCFFMKVWIFIAVVISLILIGLVFYSFRFKDIETPKYKIIKTLGEVEIREYPGMILAQTSLPKSDYNTEGNNGFRTVAGYIFGGNQSQQKIAMTAPVIMKMGDSASMSFVMPSEYSLEDLPSPSNNQVKLVSEGSKVLAVVRFGGFSNSEKIKQHADQLYSVLDSNGLKHRGELLYLGYNAPWDVTNRRNEVAVELVDFK